ncbi:sarcosine oxidase subunit delta [Chromatiales bacterium (ex Bugula neritina AB1)]|nr:sarcosine oxidase subunit delta [Chromatiales bacterium (ex Bugula neritina AB1)]
MLTIPCPFCGPRSENEFMHGGPARDVRPQDPAALTDEAWINYLTTQANPIGTVTEKWWHIRGCGAWVTIQRDTMTHAIADPADQTRKSR